MTQRKMIPLRSRDDVPPNMTEEQAQEFWATHEITEEYLTRVPAFAPDTLPSIALETRHIALRVDQDTLRRLKDLANKKGKTYQALLKEFVIQRLDEEEKREGLAASNEVRGRRERKVGS
jgi:hypothetical protein